MATDNHTDTASDLAWKMTQRLSALRCAYSVVEGLENDLHVGDSVSLPHLTELSAAKLVFRESLQDMEDLRSRVDMLPVSDREPESPVTNTADLSNTFAGVLYQFSCAISAVKVAKEGLDSKALHLAICDQAFTVAVDALNNAYNELDLAIMGISHRAAEPQS
jgi:hypothetical protein